MPAGDAVGCSSCYASSLAEYSIMYKAGYNGNRGLHETSLVVVTLSPRGDNSTKAHDRVDNVEFRVHFNSRQHYQNSYRFTELIGNNHDNIYILILHRRQAKHVHIVINVCQAD